MSFGGPGKAKWPSLKTLFPALKERRIPDLLVYAEFFEKSPLFKPGDIVDLRGESIFDGMRIKVDGRFRLTVAKAAGKNHA